MWCRIARVVLCVAGGGALAGCFGAALDETRPGSPPTAAAGQVKPLAAADLVGSWGLSSYHKPQDAPRIERQARAECGQPYSIGVGRNGGVMMHLPEQAASTEMFVKSGGLGSTYLGPGNEAGGLRDREVVKWDGRILKLRWVDSETSARYGIMVFARCGGRA